MNKKKLENNISSAVQQMMPKDAFEKISAQIVPAPKSERTRIEMKKTTNLKRFIFPAVAACFVAVIGILGFSYYNQNIAVNSVIDIDVNPSIELSTNRKDKVLSTLALNADAEKVLGEMDLKGVGLDVAVNAIVGSMVKNGYVNGEDASILVTVQNKDDQKAHTLRNEIIVDIENSLKENKVDAPIINQTVSSFGEAERFAEASGISMGKAYFIINLVKKDSSLDADALAKMSIKEIAALVKEKNINIRDIVDYDADDSIWENIDDTIDDVNEEVYDDDDRISSNAGSSLIGVDKAKSIALSHAGISASDVKIIKAELGEDDGVLDYEVEFIYNNFEYEYEINAKTGAVISAEKDGRDDWDDDDRNSSSAMSSFIGIEKAKSIALSHAGISADSAVFVKAELDEDDGVYEYDIEFVSNRVEYEYEIDAGTGNIKTSEKDIDD